MPACPVQGLVQLGGGEACPRHPGRPRRLGIAIVGRRLQLQQALPLLHQARQGEFLLLADQAHPADVLEVEAHQIGGGGSSGQTTASRVSPALPVQTWEQRFLSCFLQFLVALKGLRATPAPDPLVNIWVRGSGGFPAFNDGFNNALETHAGDMPIDLIAFGFVQSGPKNETLRSLVVGFG